MRLSFFMHRQITRGFTASLTVCMVFGILGCAPPEQRYAIQRTEAALELLTREVMRLQPDSPVLVLGNPFTQGPGASSAVRDSESAAVRGIQRGLARMELLVGVDYPELKPGALENPHAFEIPRGATTPVSFLWNPTAAASLRAKHPRARVWVSLIGLPAGVAETEAWRDAKGPKWALYLPDFSVLGSIEAVREAFASGRIVAAVLPRAGAPNDSEAPSDDPKADFQRRYLLVTRDNLGEWLESSP